MTRPTRWEKRGLLFDPAGKRPAWMASHAAVPFARRLYGSVYQVFFSTRDSLGRSLVACATLDIDKPGEILELSERPLLGPGELGEFDDSGAMLSWICPTADDRSNWYYIGWNLGRTVPFRNSIGLAIEDAQGVKRAFRGPIVDRTRDEPHFVASCCVLREGRSWRMYYLACDRWSEHDGQPRHHYHIRYAESDNGIDWRRTGRVAIDYKDAGEYAISRPSVLHAPDQGYRMWYSHRGASYRIGYAESDDGTDWRRMDEQVGIDVSTHGWDGDMICYPHVVTHDDRELMFYNGNGYGLTGFGLAQRAIVAPVHLAGKAT
jgi:hypothetical protein